MNLEIDPKYSITSSAEHCVSYWFCPECGCNTDILASPESENYALRYVCGIDEQYMVIECPRCFHRYKFHHSNYIYEAFTETIKRGENLHFK